jgi:hypothetical protein
MVGAVVKCKEQHKTKWSLRFFNSWLSGSFQTCQLLEKPQRRLHLVFAQYMDPKSNTIVPEKSKKGAYL